MQKLWGTARFPQGGGAGPGTWVPRGRRFHCFMEVAQLALSPGEPGGGWESQQEKPGLCNEAPCGLDTLRVSTVVSSRWSPSPHVCKNGREEQYFTGLLETGTG